MRQSPLLARDLVCGQDDSRDGGAADGVVDGVAGDSQGIQDMDNTDSRDSHPTNSHSSRGYSISSSSNHTTSSEDSPTKSSRRDLRVPTSRSSTAMCRYQRLCL